MQILELEIERFTRAQTIEQQQGDEGEISKRTKALPELGDLFGRKRHNDAPQLFEPEPGGEAAVRAAEAERGFGAIRKLEVVCPRRQRMSGMETMAGKLLLLSLQI